MLSLFYSSGPQRRAHSIRTLPRLRKVRLAAALVFFGLAPAEALACACGCSVFDVGGLDMPEEQDHGGRLFFEYWSQDQKQNYVGSSKAPAALNKDKDLNTQWYNVGLSYNFNRDWGIMIRVPTTANRSLTDP